MGASIPELPWVGAPPGRPVDERGRVRWGTVVFATILLSAIPALILGTRVDTWAQATIDVMSSPAATAGLVVGLLALDPVLPVPSSVLATLAGRQLGFGGATAAVFVGLCLGAALGYGLGRVARRTFIQRLLDPQRLVQAQARLGARPGMVALVASRPVPILSEAAVILSGVARVARGRVAAACGLANIGLAVVYAGLGSAAHGPLALPLALLGAVGVPALALLVAWIIGRRSVAPADVSPTVSGGPS